jgi:Nuclease-related domain
MLESCGFDGRSDGERASSLIRSSLKLTMKIYRNIGYVNRQRRRSRLMAAFGFIALVGTFPVAFLMSGNTSLVGVTYVLLLGGFLLFNRGMQGVGRWSNNARHVRPDIALDSELKDLSDRHTLIHYGEPDGAKGVVDHLLVGPAGLLVIDATDFPGQVVVKDDHWKKSGSFLLRIFSFSGPQLGNPTRDADKLFETVDKVMTEADQEADIYTSIVFTSPTVELTVDGSSHPALPVSELESFVRDMGLDSHFTTADRDAVIALFAKGDQIEEPEKVSMRRPVKVKRKVAS